MKPDQMFERSGRRQIPSSEGRFGQLCSEKYARSMQANTALRILLIRPASDLDIKLNIH